MTNFWLAWGIIYWDRLHIFFKFVSIHNYTRNIYTHIIIPTHSQTTNHIECTWHNSRLFFVHQKKSTLKPSPGIPKSWDSPNPNCILVELGSNRHHLYLTRAAKAKPTKKQTMTIISIIASSVIFQYNKLCSTFSCFFGPKMENLHKEFLHLSFDSIHIPNLFCSYIGSWKKHRSQHGHQADPPACRGDNQNGHFPACGNQQIQRPSRNRWTRGFWGFFMVQRAWNQQIMFLVGGFNPAN